MNNHKIATAALRLAAQGWEKVTIEKIAKATKISPARLHDKYKNTAALVPLIATEIDREAFGQTFSGTTHDLVFDILMARFDVMQKHRSAIINMAKAARNNRDLACALTRATIDGVYRIIEVSKITNPPRPLLATGLMAIYAWAFWAWQHDTSRDMAKTMAAMDRALRWANKGLEFISPRSR